jgi:hypothetical protein
MASSTMSSPCVVRASCSRRRKAHKSSLEAPPRLAWQLYMP